jgi:hypothetical protein
MKKDHKKEMYGLCFRCEHRAEYLHDKLNAAENDFVTGPRYECSQTGSVHSCYMYRPVRPYILKADKGEKRGLTLPWMISGRAYAVGIAKTQYVAKKVKEGLVFLCQLEERSLK